jgi:hypothetical protein
MDVNGVYYPVYESAFDSTLAGRSPLTDIELNELRELTGIDFYALNNHNRKLPAQISFNRPEESLCLDNIRDDKVKYERAIELIKAGRERLSATPRGDIESKLVPCLRHREQLNRYMERLAIEKANNFAIKENTIYMDKR